MAGEVDHLDSIVGASAKTCDSASRAVSHSLWKLICKEVVPLDMTEGFYFDARLIDVSAKQSSFAPMLSLSIDLKVSCGGSGERVDVTIPDSAIDVQVFPLSIQAHLFWDPVAQNPTDWSKHIAVGFPASMRTSTLHLEHGTPSSYQFLFPLSPTLLSQLEEGRSSGGNISYAVSLRINGEVILPNTREPFIADRVVVLRSGVQQGVHEIERSKWIDALLPEMGLGKWIVYEVPVENFDGVAQVDTYLQNAYKQYLAHEWKLCMAASRDVVESLERELSAVANPAYRDRFGSADKKMRLLVDSYGDLVEAMQSFQSASMSLLAAGAHPERPDELVERSDAELALWIALSLRRYVGLRLRTTRPPGFNPPENQG